MVGALWPKGICAFDFFHSGRTICAADAVEAIPTSSIKVPPSKHPLLPFMPSTVVGVAQDVTEAAKHDRAVAAAAHELRQLVDTANAPIFGIDVKGNVNEWNNKTAEITGYSKEEAFDKPLVETFIVTKLRRSVQEVLDNALQGRETSNYELEFRTKSNETRYLLVNATTRRDAHNNIVGVVGVAQV